MPSSITVQTSAAWFDSVFEPMLLHRRFAGLAVVLVQNDAVLVSKGYGFADALRRTPLSPEHTRVRIGSITKTMTAVLILQLVDEESIRSLDDPANRHLRRYRLPDYDGAPVTLRQLLTHTAGFESLLLGLGTEHAARVPADAAYIRQVMPRQVRAPGAQPVYSNFGFETLAAIVEDVTGQTIAEAMAQRLFRRLAMNDSTLPMGLRSSQTLGQPYAFFPNGEMQAVPYIALHPFTAGAGGVEATPADIGRYMLAQLDEERDSVQGILPSHLLRQMHQLQVGADREVAGLGLGMFVRERGGVRILDHPGSWPGFNSLMTLLPEQRLGLFITALAAAPVPNLRETLLGSKRLRATAAVAIEPALDLGNLYEIREAFLDHFLGASAAAPRLQDVRPLLGSYLDANRSYTRAESVLQFFQDPTIVRTAGADAIEVNGTGPFSSIGGDMFVRHAPLDDALPDGPQSYRFVRGSGGEVTYLVDGTGLGVSERIAPFESPPLWRRYVLCVMLLCLSALLLLRLSGRGTWQRLTPWLPLGVIACVATQGLVFFAGFSPGRSLFFEILAGHSRRLAALVLLGDVIVACVLAMIAAAIAAWFTKYWGAGLSGTLARVQFSVITLVATGLVPILAHLNLLGAPSILR